MPPILPNRWLRGERSERRWLRSERSERLESTQPPDLPQPPRQRREVRDRDLAGRGDLADPPVVDEQVARLVVERDVPHPGRLAAREGTRDLRRHRSGP